MSRRSPEFMEHVGVLQDVGLTFIDAVKHVAAHAGEYREEAHQKAAERERVANLVSTWNARCPPGTRVAMRFVRGGPEYETTTRSKAWLLGDGSPAVLIEGRAGGWGLDFVRALAEGEHLPPMPARGEVAA